MPLFIRAIFQGLLRILVVGSATIVGWLGLNTEIPPSSEQSIEEQRIKKEEHADRVSERMAEAGFREVSGQIQTNISTSTTPEMSPEFSGPKIFPTAPVIESSKPITPIKTDVVITTLKQQEKIKEVPIISEEKLPEIIAPDIDDEPKKDVEELDDIKIAERTTVNVVCLRKIPGGTSVSSGSGVVISPEGLVATDAHVARFFLLSENDVSCSITHPGMPVLGHKSHIVYISPDWIKDNADAPGGAHPTGTGEEDYAFVAIEESSFTPKVFDYAPINTNDDAVEKEDRVAIAGYPGAPKSLFDFGAKARFEVDETFIYKFFSFSGGTQDVLLTEATPVAAEGASGGGLFKNGKLIGLIVTTVKTPKGLSASALTLSYINRDLRKDVGVSIDDLINSDHKETSKDFATENKNLRKLIESAL